MSHDGQALLGFSYGHHFLVSESMDQPPEQPETEMADMVYNFITYRIGFTSAMLSRACQSQCQYKSAINPPYCPRMLERRLGDLYTCDLVYIPGSLYARLAPTCCNTCMSVLSYN